MNGAETLVKTLLASDVTVCFANPGTSEMHFVAALDTHPEMRCILCLFEGGVTGAADGYARMSGNVAGTLLHLGPGFANAWANIHNARKAGSGMVNVVGDHAGFHLKHDAPLQSDLDGVAGTISHFTRRATDASLVGRLGAEAIQAARDGQIATLILQADAAWSEGDAAPDTSPPPIAKHRPEVLRIAAAAKALTQPGDMNAELLKDISNITLVGENPPVNFFAYPGKPSTPEAPGCAVDRLCYDDWDIIGTLQGLADAVGVDGTEIVQRIALDVPDLEGGTLTSDGIGRALARILPEEAIVINEAMTAGQGIFPWVRTAARHDRISNTGGSIGQCLPNALGAAVACPDRPVFAISGDGSAMYQLQSLWTAARERLNITVVIIANKGYQILHHELAAQGAPQAGKNARAMFGIEDPLLDWVALANGHGVMGERVDTEEALADALKQANATDGPYLIEAAI